MLSRYYQARLFLLNRDGEVVATYKRFRAGDEAGIKQEIESLMKQ